ncbi:MAG: hypothetical protein PVI30_07060 [Myxococcales bacterium]|jgi:PBP1b-binding outer membrane lipoprotein LpoB
MKKIMIIAAALLGAAFMSACSGDKPEPQPEPPPVESPEEAPAEEAPAEPEEQAEVAEPTAEQVPVPEDFEAAAESEITLDNYKAELDALEAELAKADAP